VRRFGRFGFPSAVILLACTLLLPGCAYICKQAGGQLRLLAGRVPLDKAVETVEFTQEELEMLGWVPRIKEYGEAEIGLSPTKNYTTINPDFDSVVWNVSGAAPDSFTSHVYRYPVVGDLPYIGFFDRADAEAERDRLAELGWEPYLRGAGAYSTLGWFKDPLWRSMLAWDIEQMSNTVLHELAHATLWLRGEGKFNESFAAFVGDEASRRFLRDLSDERPEVWQTFLDEEEDRAQYRAFMHSMVRRLEALYGAGLARDEVLAQRDRVIEQGRTEYRELDWHLAGYARAMNPNRTLNNARLKQFRVYNTGLDDFDEALVRFDGDLKAFVQACATELPRAKRKGGRDWDPYEALRQLSP
jgi:predicted aminopeptidase